MACQDFEEGACDNRRITTEGDGGHGEGIAAGTGRRRPSPPSPCPHAFAQVPCGIPSGNPPCPRSPPVDSPPPEDDLCQLSHADLLLRIPALWHFERIESGARGLVQVLGLR